MQRAGYFDQILKLLIRLFRLLENFLQGGSKDNGTRIESDLPREEASNTNSLISDCPFEYLGEFNVKAIGDALMQIAKTSVIGKQLRLKFEKFAGELLERLLSHSVPGSVENKSFLFRTQLLHGDLIVLQAKQHIRRRTCTPVVKI